MSDVDLIVLTQYLAARGYGGYEIADAVKKPWHYHDEYRVACAVLDHESEHPGHTCRPHDRYGDGWYCDPDGGQPCAWEVRRQQPIGGES